MKNFDSNLENYIPAIISAISIGTSEKQIVIQLKKDGVSEQIAIEMIEKAKLVLDKHRAELHKAEIKDKSKDLITQGIILFAGGFLFTIITYFLAIAKGGGVYYIYWGAMLYGIIQLVRGFIYRNKIQTNEEENYDMEIFCPKNVALRLTEK